MGYPRPSAVAGSATFEGEAASPADPQAAEDDMLRMMVLISPEGTVLSAKGADAEEFATVTAYATQLSQLLGQSLGLEGFEELDCEFKKGRCVIYLDESGNTVGVRPRPEMPMAKIREMLGFR